MMSGGSVTLPSRTTSPGFGTARTGNNSHMERSDLIQEMFESSSPNETSTALSDAREWLRDHPKDQTVISAMEDLIEVERQTLGAY